MQWLADNIGTIIVLLIVAVISGLASYSVIKNKMKGGCSCGCGCTGCPMAGKCHAEKESQNGPEEKNNGQQ